VGLVGQSAITAQVTDAQGHPVTATALVRWAGGDGVFDTADDVLLELPVVDGELAASGLPEGTYRVEQVGSTVLDEPTELTAGTARPVVIEVSGPTEPATPTPPPTDDPTVTVTVTATVTATAVPVPLPAPDAPTPTTVRPRPAPRTALPYTGTHVADLASAGLALLLAGAVALWRGRRTAR